MNKKLKIGLMSLVLLVISGYFANAMDVVATAINDVETDIGTLSLPVGTHLGQGFEGKVAIMTQGAYIDVGQGPVYYPEDTEIDCDDPEPGYPDPCDPY